MLFIPWQPGLFLNMATGNHLEMVFFFMGKSWTFYFPWWGFHFSMFEGRGWHPVIGKNFQWFHHERWDFSLYFLGFLCLFRVGWEWMKNWDLTWLSIKIHGYTVFSGFWYRWPSYSWFTYWNCVSIAMLLCQRILCVEVGWEWFSKLQTHTKKRYPLVI